MFVSLVIRADKRAKGNTSGCFATNGRRDAFRDARILFKTYLVRIQFELSAIMTDSYGHYNFLKYP